MKNKSGRYFVIALLCLPLIIAIVVGSKIDPMKLSGGTLKSVAVMQGDTELYSFDDEENLKSYIDLTSNATLIDHPVRSIENDTPIEIKFVENDSNTHTYKFYMTKDGEECYFQNAEGKYYRLDKSDASALVLREEFYSVYPESRVPTITLSSSLGTSIYSCASSEWKWQRADGKLIEKAAQSAQNNEVLKLTGATDWKLLFSSEPYQYEISFKKNGSEAVITDNDFASVMQSLVYDTDTKIEIMIHAEWYSGKEGDYSSTADYVVNAFYDVPSSVKLDDKGLRQGGFTVARLSNFNDDEELKIESTLSLGHSKVYDYNGQKFAFITIGCENPNGVSKIGVNGTQFDFEIKPIDGYTDDPDIPSIPEDKKTANTNESHEEYREKIIPLLSNSEAAKLWDGKFISPLENGKTLLPFAKKRLISTSTGYRHEAVDYTAAEGDAVRATNGGKVVFAGTTTLFGNLIVIDHGYDIFSYYGHLSAIGCAVGDKVEKSAKIGEVGSTGFALTPQLHFAMSIGEYFIEPIHTSGISFPD